MFTAAMRVPFAMDCVASSVIVILHGKISFYLSLYPKSYGFQLNHIIAAQTDYLSLHAAQEWILFPICAIWAAGQLASWCTGVIANLLPHQA